MVTPYSYFNDIGIPLLSPASETLAGVAEVATQAEADAGTDDSRFVTPLKIATRPQKNLVFETFLEGLKLSITAAGGSAGTRGANGDHVQLSVGAAWIPSLNRIYNVASTVTGPTMTFSASTFYYFYLYDNAGTPSLDISTTAPAAYKSVAQQKTSDNTRRYLGAMKTNSSSVLYPSTRQGDWVFYTVNSNSTTSPFAVLQNGGGSSPATQSCSGIVPPTSTLAHCGIYQSGAGVALFSNSDISGTLSSTNFWFQMSATTYTGAPLLLNSSQAFMYMTTTGLGLYVVVLGYLEER